MGLDFQALATFTCAKPAAKGYAINAKMFPMEQLHDNQDTCFLVEERIFTWDIPITASRKIIS